jgi:tetratricopeptide (TPR) repeat protein
MTDIQRSYILLGVQPGASSDEIKAAYYALVRKWHPDRVQDDGARRDAAEEKLKQINVAYDRLQMHVAQPAHAAKAERASGKTEAERSPEWSRSPNGYQRNSSHRAYARAAGASFKDEPEEESGSGRAFALYEDGLEHFRAGRWQEAVSAIVQSVCLYPNNAEAHLTLGMAYRIMKMPAKAVAAFKQAARFDPESEEAQVNLGETCLEIGEYREAIYFASQYLRRRPLSPSVLVTLGAAYRHLNRMPQALEALSKAVKMDPKLVSAHFELGEAYLKSGQTERAREIYETLRTLDSDLAVKLLLSIINR